MIGVVTYLIEAESGRGGPDVFVAAARGPDMSVMGYATGANIMGSGAGLSWENARGAAVGECLERYAACIVNGNDLLAASYHSMVRSGRDAHDPSTWALFDNSQQVPYPTFSKDRIITWSEGWDLTTSKPIFLPACFAHLSSSPVLRESGADVVGPGVSTGCACAMSTNESLLKGLCELIERDAFLIVWRNRLQIPEVAIDKGSTLYEVYTEKFARPGLEYRIWQTTLDFPMPSFFGIVFDHRGPKTRMIVGGAANPDAELAVQKTLCELVQGLSWLEYMGEPKEGGPANFEEIRNFTDRARLYAFRELPDAYSFLFGDREPVRLSSIRSKRAPVEKLLRDCIAEVAAKGFRPAAIDLTTDDLRECGYVVTRVVVPGLETMDGDYRLQMLGGARWRQVPLQLGFQL
jgi:ribosomal protein S12 methylthiotransferase accessory factor